MEIFAQTLSRVHARDPGSALMAQHRVEKLS
jgi:hypothetical protein